MDAAINETTPATSTFLGRILQVLSLTKEKILRQKLMVELLEYSLNSWTLSS